MQEFSNLLSLYKCSAETGAVFLFRTRQHGPCLRNQQPDMFTDSVTPNPTLLHLWNSSGFRV